MARPSNGYIFLDALIGKSMAIYLNSDLSGCFDLVEIGTDRIVVTGLNQDYLELDPFLTAAKEAIECKKHRNLQINRKRRERSRLRKSKG